MPRVLGPFLGASWPAVNRSGVPRVLGLSGFGCACWGFSRPWAELWPVSVSGVPGLRSVADLPRSLGRFSWGGAAAGVPRRLGRSCGRWACLRSASRAGPARASWAAAADLRRLLPAVDFLHMLFHWARRVIRHKRGRVCRIGFRGDLAGARRGAGAWFPGAYSPLEFFPGLYSP